MLTASRTFNVHEHDDVLRRGNDWNNNNERSITEHVKSNRKKIMENKFQTKNSEIFIIIIDGNRKVIDESSKKNVTLNWQVNAKAIEPSSPLFLPLDNKNFD